jgi:tetratricopeptide (TPR) repeat protein
MLDNDMEFGKYFFEIDQLVSGIRYSARTSTLEEKLEKLEQSLPLMDLVTAERKPSYGWLQRINEQLNEFFDILSLKWALTTTQVKLALSGVAASVVTVMTALLMIFRTPSPDALFLNNFAVPLFDDFSITRGNDNINISYEKRLFETAMLKYNQKDYSGSAAILSAIPVDKMDPEMKLYTAIVNIETKNYPSAVGLLNQLKDSNDQPYWANQAKWYLALCLIREKKYDEARMLLEKVQDFGNTNHEKEAGKLLKELK